MCSRGCAGNLRQEVESADAADACDAVERVIALLETVFANSTRARSVEPPGVVPNSVLKVPPTLPIRVVKSFAEVGDCGYSPSRSRT